MLPKLEEVTHMFCSNCGTKAAGNFCSACGASLQFPAKQEQANVKQLGDWTCEFDYETLLEQAEVRDRIARASQRCPNRISGDDVLALFDAIQPTGVPVGKLVKGLLPVLDRMGIKTGKRSEIEVQASAGHAMVAVLCAMAAQGYNVQSVDQSAESCVLTALIPSTVWTHAGELVCSIQRERQSIKIQAATKISGQLFDWGTSSRILRELFDDVCRELPADGSASRRVA